MQDSHSKTRLLGGHVLVVDDDAQMRSMLRDFFVTLGCRVDDFARANLALDVLKGGRETCDSVDLVVSDINMPGMDGMEFLDSVKEFCPEIPVVLITAFGTVDAAIEAIRRGAYDYLIKPFKLSELGITVDRAIEFRRIQKENHSLKGQLKSSWGYHGLIGKSVGMQRVFDLIRRVSNATANVLITGESGTGKEMVARAIHQSGQRAAMPFIAINCAAIPETLLESELFGHSRGAFTGAEQRKRGLFEEAHGGTLFLDEIGDMDLSLQTKLLRAIQEKKIRAVGDNQFKDIDVRIIAATHQDLKTEVREGRFREDLFYRLSVIPVAIPPLRERPEDIPLLVEHFLKKFTGINGSHVRGFSKPAMAKMMGLRYEGNVRELENLIERIVVLSDKSYIDVDEIPGGEAGSAEEFFQSATGDLPTLEQLEKRYIGLVMQKTQGKKEKAAEILGINRRTLYRKEREYNLSSPS